MGPRWCGSEPDLSEPIPAKTLPDGFAYYGILITPSIKVAMRVFILFMTGAGGAHIWGEQDLISTFDVKINYR